MASQVGDVLLRGRHIGAYRLVGRLGQGGQGSVFEGLRDDGRFQQRVAIKIVKWEIDGEGARARFRQERKILAGLEHPHIARLLDGGETEDGLPYLVMEFVEGEPLTKAAGDWPIRRKLDVFLKVLDAVSFAHQNLIVHRDLKPGNILVTKDGSPKLLDFGIAKLMDPEATRTHTGFVGLTPDYASPEQVRGLPISTSSDVYSLGVVLYQLLTGRKPYALDTATPMEMDRVIVHEPPAPPGLGDELNHILLMALRKEPERRYHTVEAFARDIERYIDHRPILARPDTLWYRTGKYVRRHWIGLAAASLALTGLIGGAGVAVYQARRAQRQFNQVRQLANRFLFDFDDEIAKIPGNVKAREMIVSTALQYLNQLAAESSGDPGLQWEVARAFGKVAAVQGSTTTPSLRRPRDGLVSYERAFVLARPLDDRKLLNEAQRGDLVNMLCEAELLHRSLQEYDTALRLGREAIARSERLPPSLRSHALGEMAISLRVADDLTGSLDLWEKIVPERRAIAQQDGSFDNRRSLATALSNLADTRNRLTLFAKAQAAGTEALEIYRSLAEARPKDPALQRRIQITLTFLGDIAANGDAPSL